MKLKISLFYIGIILIIIGSIEAGILLNQTNQNSSNFLLEKTTSNTMSIKLKGEGIGYYLISSDSYQNNILAKVIDSHGNFLDIRKITNKITVDYFRYEHNEQVTLEVTNLSDKPVQLSTTLGDTRVSEIMIPAILIFVGAIILVFSGFKKLRNYIIEHPEENNS